MTKETEENIGAVTDSVSLEKIASYVHEVIADHNEAKTTSTSEVALDKFLNECKDFIIGYAKKCYAYPEDQAYALREFFINKRIEDEAAANQQDMPDTAIVVDTVKLIDIATDLMGDFLGKHEEANDSIAEIMTRHVPRLQAELNQRRERMENKK